MGNWTLVWGTTFILLLFMTSEAVNDELHASDPSFLSTQNTRLGREGRNHTPTPFPPTHTSTPILWAKQIHQNLNKHPCLKKICTSTKKIKEEKLKYTVKNESAVSFCVIFPLSASEQQPDLHKSKCNQTASWNMHSITYTLLTVD